ncbi:MAG: type IV toxin-antitoxin system AbiEi family antitoxin domain-containing protein [Myxococcales bacterium]|nr:type IV toxin-antitoxin system AbiEi family antitoxin domain-containing protein [Myxococcales bacterium]
MSTSTSKISKLLRLAEKGPLRARDLDAADIPRAYLARLVDKGVLEQAGRGLYRLASAATTEHHSLAEVAARVPHGTICLLSALQVHGLTTEAPHAVWLMIDTRARKPSLDTPAVELVKAKGPAREHGQEMRIIEGVRVRITTPAKTVADCFRYRRHVGLDVAVAALRDYVARCRQRGAAKRDYSLDALLEASKADRVAKVMRPYVEALA